MTPHQTLSTIQRNAVATIFLAWVAGVAVMATRPPYAVALTACCLLLAVMSGALLYLYRTARCQRCGKALWLQLHRIAPFGPFKPRMTHCSCGASFHETSSLPE